MEIDNRISAVATAAAVAFIQVDAHCEAQGNAFAMLDATAFVVARAEAFAEAVSGILDSANVCPNCTIVTEAIVRTSQSIIAKAFGEAGLQVLSSQLLLPVEHC